MLNSLKRILIGGISLLPLFLSAGHSEGHFSGGGGHVNGGNNLNYVSRQRYDYNQVNVNRGYNNPNWSSRHNGHYDRVYHKDYYYNNYYVYPGAGYYGGPYPAYYYSYPYYDAYPYSPYYTYPSYDTGPNVGLYLQFGR